MAAMSTALAEFQDTGNSRTYTAPDHSVLKPRLVIQKRRIAPSPAGVAEDSVKVVFGTVDSDGNPIIPKISMEVVIRRSPSGADTDMTAAKALFREIIASTNLDSVISGQGWLQ